MPTKTGKPYGTYYGNDLAIDQSTNTGVDEVSRRIQDGFGNNTAMIISDDALLVKPISDNMNATLAVLNKTGSTIFAVDTLNNRVLASLSQVAINTQYSYFGIDASGSVNFEADIHYAIPFVSAQTAGVGTATAMGAATTSSFNDTEPGSSLTLSTYANLDLQAYWYVMDNITIDEIKWWHAADAATGDDVAAHVMAYTVVTTAGATSGDLSSGVVVADGATITNAGYEQAYYQAMTIQSADVDAGKVILFTFASDTVNSDYTINATVKYHLR